MLRDTKADQGAVTGIEALGGGGLAGGGALNVSVRGPLVSGAGRAPNEPPRLVVGYAPGAWDLFHVGHLNVLRHAARNCDFLIAGVVDDDMLERAKGARPVIPVAERAEIVRAISFVDEVVVEDQPDKLETWRRRPFDVFFKGDDWRGTPQGDVLERRFAEVGVDVVYFPYTMHTSSTALRRALAALEVGHHRADAFAE